METRRSRAFTEFSSAPVSSRTSAQSAGPGTESTWGARPRRSYGGSNETRPKPPPYVQNKPSNRPKGTPHGAATVLATTRTNSTSVTATGAAPVAAREKKDPHAATALEALGWGVGPSPWAKKDLDSEKSIPEERWAPAQLEADQRPQTAKTPGSPSQEASPRRRRQRPMTAPAHRSTALERVSARLGHLPAALSSEHARSVLLGSAQEASRFEPAHKRMGRITCMLSSAADQRRIAQTTHAEKLFRPETESVTQQVFFHVGRFKRDEAVVTSRRATAKQKGELGDAFSEMDRTQKRVAAPIDVTANESKQIVDAIVWAAEEGKAQSSLLHWEATLEKSPNIGLNTSSMQRLEKILHGLQGKKPEMVGKLVELCKFYMVVGSREHEHEGAAFDRVLALCTDEEMPVFLECPTYDRIPNVLSSISPDLGSDPHFKLLPKPIASNDPRLVVLAFLGFLIKFLEKPSAVVTDVKRAQKLALVALACCWKFLRGDTVPHPDYGLSVLRQLDAMLSKWVLANPTEVQNSIFARGGCGTLSMVIKRLLQLYPELVRTKEYAGVRIRLIKLFQMGEMERMSWGRLKTRNIGMMKSLLPVPMIPREACKKIAKQQTQAKAAVPPPPPSPLSVSCNLSTRMRPRSARGRLLPGVSVEDHALAVVTKSGISVGSMPDFLTGGLSEKPGASGARRNRALSRERSKNNDRGAQGKGSSRHQGQRASAVSNAMSRSGSQRDAPKGAKGKEKGPHPARGPAAKHSPWQAPHQGSRQAGSSPGKRGQAGISMAVAGHTVGAVQHLAQAQHGGWSDHQDIAGVRDVSEALERARARGSVAGGKYPVMGAGGPEKGREREGSRGAAAGMALQRSVARRRGPAEMPPRKEGKEQRKRPPSGRPMSAHASLSSTRQVSEMVLRPDVFYRKSGDIMAPARELMDVHRVSRTRKLHFLEKALQGDPVALALFDENTSWDPESIKAYVGLSQRPGREV